MAEAAAAMAERRRALGEKIRAARQDKHWKQKTLAAAVNVEPMTVSRWERGQHAPDWEMIELIAEVLEKPFSYFLDDFSSLSEDAATATLAPVLARLDALQSSVDALRQVVDRLVRTSEPTPSATAQGRH